MNDQHTTWYHKLSLKVFIWVLAGVILPIALLLLYAGRSYEQYIRRELSSRTITQLDRSEEEIYNIFRRMVNISSVICTNEEFQRVLQDESQDRYHRTICFDDLVKTIEVNNLYDLDGIKITCFDRRGDVYANWSTNYNDYDFLFAQGWVQQSLQAGGYVQWNMFSPAYVLEENGRTNYVSLARSLLASSGGARLATVIVSLEQATLSQALGQFLYEPSDAVYICTEKGQAVLSLDSDQVLDQQSLYELADDLHGQADGSEVIQTGSQSYLLSYYTLSQPYTFNGEELKVLYLIRYDHIMHEMDRLTGRILWALLACVGVVVLIAFVIAKVMTRPIETLSARMLAYRPEEEITGLDFRRKDEIGQLNRAFREMACTISDLFTRQRRETEERERYRFESLRAQVNPHFLFNTLNTIRWMAIIRHADNIVDCIDALATMMKYSMNRGGELVTLKEELQNIYSYIYISNCRYGNRLRFESDLDESLQELYVVKFILQPIVENAVLHGFKGIDRQGVILLYGDIEGDVLKLYVEDNGTGLTPQAEEQLHRPRGKVTGIGVGNVNARIQSSYGDGFGVRVYNGTAGGTVAEYTLPILREGDHDEKDTGC